MFIQKYYDNKQSFKDVNTCPSDQLSRPLSSLNLVLSPDDFKAKIRIIVDFFTSSKNRSLKNEFNSSGGIKVKPKTVIKSVLTDFIIGDIVSNESSRIFIYLLNLLCKTFFSTYRRVSDEDYRLIFKGGNVTKIYFDDFIDNYFDEDLKPEIYTKYGSSFRDSDFDFTIENFNFSTTKTRQQQADYLSPILWYILTIARIIILSNVGNLYNFCRFNSLNMKLLLSNIKENLKVFDKFDRVNFIGICFDEYTYLPHHSLRDLKVRNNKFQFFDIFNQMNQIEIDQGKVPIFFVDGNSKREDGLIVNVYDSSHDSTEVSVYSLNHFNVNLFDGNVFERLFQGIVSTLLPDEYSQLFLSNSLDIRGTNNRFSLERLMLNFIVIYSENEKIGSLSVPSELYDITYIVENLITNFHLKSEFKFNNYHYNFVESDGKIIDDDIIIMSEFEVANDLIEILFVLNQFPWSDNKYQKRIIRLIFISRYIQEKMRLNPITGLDTQQFLIDVIIKEYFPKIENKINSLPISTVTQREDKKKNEEEFKKMKRIIDNTQRDINSYFSRTIKRLNVESNITRLI